MSTKVEKKKTDLTLFNKAQISFCIKILLAIHRKYFCHYSAIVFLQIQTTVFFRDSAIKNTLVVFFIITIKMDCNMYICAIIADYRPRNIIKLRIMAVADQKDKEIFCIFTFPQNQNRFIHQNHAVLSCIIVPKFCIIRIKIILRNKADIASFYANVPNSA